MRLLPSLLALFLVAQPAMAEVSITTGRPVPLQGGTPVFDKDSGVRLALIDVTDQRCPAEVDCYWEGMIRLEISVQPASGTAETVILCNICDDGDRSAAAAGLRLYFDTLAPSTADLARMARTPILSDYTATIGLLP